MSHPTYPLNGVSASQVRVAYQKFRMTDSVTIDGSARLQVTEQEENEKETVQLRPRPLEAPRW